MFVLHVRLVQPIYKVMMLVEEIHRVKLFYVTKMNMFLRMNVYRVQLEQQIYPVMILVVKILHVVT